MIHDPGQGLRERRTAATALMEAIAKLGEEAAKAGVMVENGGLLPSERGTRIRIAGAKVAVTDGPFSEAKALIGSYAVYETKTKEDSVERARRFAELHTEHWPSREGWDRKSASSTTPASSPADHRPYRTDAPGVYSRGIRAVFSEPP